MPLRARPSTATTSKTPTRRCDSTGALRKARRPAAARPRSIAAYSSSPGTPSSTEYLKYWLSAAVGGSPNRTAVRPPAPSPIPSGCSARLWTPSDQSDRWTTLLAVCQVNVSQTNVAKLGTNRTASANPISPMRALPTAAQQHEHLRRDEQALKDSEDTGNDADAEQRAQVAQVFRDLRRGPPHEVEQGEEHRVPPAKQLEAGGQVGGEPGSGTGQVGQC